MVTMRVPSGVVRSKSTFLSTSTTYQSMLWPTRWRSPAETATAVQKWAEPGARGQPSAAAARCSSVGHVNSSAQLGTSSLTNGCPEPSAMPSSSSTYWGR